MILPVVAYGHPVLKHVAEDIEENSPDTTLTASLTWRIESIYLVDNHSVLVCNLTQFQYKIIETQVIQKIIAPIRIL